MPINQEKVTRLIGALQSKDVAAITAAQVNIPFLAAGYTEAQLQAWLDKRITRLQSLSGNATEAQALAARTTLYNALNAAGKVVADKIIAGESWTPPANTSNANYDRLIGIKLITWVLV